MEKNPNILMIMTDQHRFDCLGCHGHPLLKTPNIDKLAARGVDFQRCYSSSAICMPSRVSAFTGQYIHTHGLMQNHRVADITHLTTLPNLLKEKGYQTSAFGKTHAGPSDVMGFEDFAICAGLAEGETNAYKEYLAEKGFSEADPHQAFKAYDAYTSTIPYEHTNEVWTANCALDYLKNRDAGKPFFMWLSFERPHPATCVPPDNPFPYNPDDIELPKASEWFYTGPDTKRAGCENAWNVFNTGEAKMKQALANYYSLISMIDDQIGRVIARLEEEGALGNTIIVFTADHGEFAGGKGQFGKNISTYDELYRIPFIWCWPGQTDRDPVHELVSLVDFMPTVLELIGEEIPKTVQGVSRANAIRSSARRGGVSWDGADAVFFETPFTKTVRTKTHKLSINHKGDRGWGQLYDLVKNPEELDNLYDRPEQAWIQQKLTMRLLQWFIETQQPQIHGVPDVETAPPWRWYQ